MSYGVLECDIVMLQKLHAYDFVIKKALFCAGPCTYKCREFKCTFTSQNAYLTSIFFLQIITTLIIFKILLL